MDRDVCFDADGTASYGTLRVPAHPSAAALLLAGSGPTDRDGNVPRLNVLPYTLKLIADLLGTLGIMSLRFDKYFSGRTGGGGYAAHPQDIDLDAFVRQAVAAYEFLREAPRAPRQNMLIAGHSEGGLYALLVARITRPRGLALLEPQAERLLTSIKTQIAEHLADDAVEPAVAARNADAAARAIDSFRAGRPPRTEELLPDVVAMLRPVLLTKRNERYVRVDDAVRPADIAARIAPGTRVLLTAGTRDANVPPSTVGPLADALRRAGTTGPGLRTLHDVDHFLRAPGGRGLAPEVAAALTEWASSFKQNIITTIIKPLSL